MYHCELTRPPTSANSYRKSQSRLKVLGAWLNPEILRSQQKLDSITRPFTSRMLQCAIPLNARLLRTLGIPWISQFVFSKVPKCLPRPQSKKFFALRLARFARGQTVNNNQIKLKQKQHCEQLINLATIFKCQKSWQFQFSSKCGIPVQCEMQVRRTIVSHRFESLIFV